MKVLVTGGAGYIGSTVATALAEAGHVPVVLDDLSRGARAFTRGWDLYVGDYGDRALIRRIIDEHPDLHATIHCGAKIVVPESVAHPYDYYLTNVSKSLELVDELVQRGKARFIFSSSGSVYAPSDSFEVHEESPLAPTSPYARTKMVLEMALADIAAGTDLQVISLRYFNPVGASPSLRSGTRDALPSHVVGRLVAAARGDVESFVVTGTDLPTRDGTGLRDYVHVWDLARAHVATVERFEDALEKDGGPSSVINLGTGQGVTVRELVAAFERVSGPVPISEGPPRPGDAIGAWANVDKAARLLGWHSELGLDEGIASALAWDRRRAEVVGD